MLFLQLFFCNHTAIRLQSHCDKVAITHMLIFATAFFLQSHHISGCNHTVTNFAITRIFTRLQPHQANTNLVAIWQRHAAVFSFQTHVSGSSEPHTQLCCNHTHSLGLQKQCFQ
jgi:hypothetical protein